MTFIFTEMYLCCSGFLAAFFLSTERVVRFEPGTMSGLTVAHGSTGSIM